MAKVSIGKVDLQPGAQICLNIKGKKLALANINGKYYCTDSACTHMGGPLCEGKIGEKSVSSVTCLLHGSVFDFENGKVLKGPAAKPVKSYPVTVKDGELFVDL